MNTRDVSRILRGVSMVVDQIVLRKQPDFALKVERLTYHLNEMLKVIMDYKTIENESSNSNQSSSSSSNNRSTSVSNNFTMNNNTDNNNNVIKANIIIEEEEVDLIGFKKMIQQPATSIETETVISKQHQESVIKTVTDNKENVVDVKKQMRERAVPSTQVGRLFGFGSLAMRMAMGEVVDRASNALAGNTGPRMISDDNADRLAEALCRMRGAALKLGQMLVLQDESSLPPPLMRALDRVKQAADYMPKRQLEAQLVGELGENWRDNFIEFNVVPIAAASIGQVHKATLLDGTEVAIKIQYPGVSDSIDSDLSNLKRVVQMTNLLPPGLFVDNIIQVASVELKAECDYNKELIAQQEYRDLILADKVLRKHCHVPEVYPAVSSKRILTTKFVPGLPIDSAIHYSQDIRNAIARTVLIVTIRELFEWRFIQSDPNYANFLYDHPSLTINMIDFGAARKYDKSFVDGYMRLVWAAANKDKGTILEVSKTLGFLTGDETQEFTDVHVNAGLIVGEPFLYPGSFDFGNSKLTHRLSSYGSTFVKYRLTPPPTEAYSLHRKLGGAFLLCIKLKANIPCRDILEKTFMAYKFD